MAPVPQWFACDVALRLRDVRRVPGSLQHYACCPVPRHGDRHRSFAIRPGDTIPLIYFCQGGCANEEIREALAALGVHEEHLGPLGTPGYERRRRESAASAERRELERLRGESATLKETITGLLNARMTQAMRHISIQAAIEGISVPDERREFIALAGRAGVSQSKRYEAWAQVYLAAGQPECVSVDHVVLTPAGEDCQTAQDSGHVRFTSGGTIFPEREDLDSPRGKTDELDTALEALRSAGLTGNEAA